MRHTRMISLLLAASLVISAFPVAPAVVSVEAADSFTANYGEALQKSLYFYEAQQAGPLPDWNRVEWRGDSTMEDYIKGGWYDAGDHVKFNLPMAYSASMLAWGMYTYGDGIAAVGEEENYLHELTWVLDYLAACDQGDTVVYQVGNGTKDHSWWGPVELLEYGMEDQGIDPEEARSYITGRNASAVYGEMAAALAAGYCALDGKVSESVREGYLSHAKAIFAMADEDRSDDGYNDSNASNFYRSSHFYDELFYAANWLYLATGEQSYLDLATSYIPNLGKELGTSELKYSWCMCWDDVQQGGMVLYAMNTKNSTYINQVKKHLDYWTYNVKELEGGLRWSSTWGSLRYATTAGFIAAVACDTVLQPAGMDTSAYETFYREQINYCLGDNPNHLSYEVGYGSNYVRNVHHRTAHGSWKNALSTPKDNRHILYGALVGGPDETGTYCDDREQYIYSEVACDYNAGFTALLAKMCSVSGGSGDPDFPEPEQRDQELYVETTLKTASASGVTVSFKLTNHTAWPARVVNNLSYRYYMDLSEVLDAGYQASDVVVRCDRDQAQMYSDYANAEISGLIHDEGSIYYIEVTYPDGRVALPVSEGMHQCELLLAFVFPNYGSGWDASNDYSNQDLLDAGEEPVISEKIPLYQDGNLIFGQEPNGKQPTVTTTTTKSATTTTTTTTVTAAQTTTSAHGSTTTASTTAPQTTITSGSTASKPDVPENAFFGDVNLDNAVSLADLIMFQKYWRGALVFNEQQLVNANVEVSDAELNDQDTHALLQFLIGTIDALPV